MKKMKNKKIWFYSLILFISTNSIYAATFKDLSKNVVNNIFTKISEFGISLAVLFILWAGFNLVKNGGDASKRAEAQKQLGYGILAIFVMVSIWGIVTLITNSESSELGLDNSNKIDIKFDNGGGNFNHSMYSQEELNQLNGVEL